MSDETPSFFARLILSWVAYFRILIDAEFAGRVQQVRDGAAPALPAPRKERAEEEPDEPKKKKPKPAKPAPVLKEAGPDAALQLLALLQREGRFLDFLSEDLSGADDEAIGAAVRVVHAGCKKALDEHIEVEPIHEGEEGATVSVEEGFDAHRIRLTGNVVGDAPYRGELSHRGWRAKKVRLPKMSEGHDPTILAPAEVTLP